MKAIQGIIRTTNSSGYITVLSHQIGTPVEWTPHNLTEDVIDPRVLNPIVDVINANSTGLTHKWPSREYNLILTFPGLILMKLINYTKFTLTINPKFDTLVGVQKSISGQIPNPFWSIGVSNVNRANEKKNHQWVVWADSQSFQWWRWFILPWQQPSGVECIQLKH